MLKYYCRALESGGVFFRTINIILQRPAFAPYFHRFFLRHVSIYSEHPHTTSTDFPDGAFSTNLQQFIDDNLPSRTARGRAVCPEPWEIHWRTLPAGVLACSSPIW